MGSYFIPDLLHFDFFLGHNRAGLGGGVTRLALSAHASFGGFTAGSIFGFAASFHVGAR